MSTLLPVELLGGADDHDLDTARYKEAMRLSNISQIVEAVALCKQLLDTTELSRYLHVLGFVCLVDYAYDWHVGEEYRLRGERVYDRFSLHQHPL